MNSNRESLSSMHPMPLLPPLNLERANLCDINDYMTKYAGTLMTMFNFSQESAACSGSAHLPSEFWGQLSSGAIAVTGPATSSSNNIPASQSSRLFLHTCVYNIVYTYHFVSGRI